MTGIVLEDSIFLHLEHEWNFCNGKFVFLATAVSLSLQI